MDIAAASPLLGGLTPQVFMRRHWQKQPLLIRQAVPGVVPPLARGELFALAGRDDVESRLVVQADGGWTLRHGPVAKRLLPSVKQAGWTLLVQGVDLHVAAAHALLSRFRFVPDARLDDLMMSYATDGGGVGPHFDSYDVFLLQVQGRGWTT
jgi:50S ribosomal protein L16 3-hydroxylase